MTEEQIKKAIEKGAKRWTKNGYDRLYISTELAGSEWSNYFDGCLPMNRREKQNAKLFIDIESGKINVVGVYHDDKVKEFLNAFIFG